MNGAPKLVTAVAIAAAVVVCPGVATAAPPPGACGNPAPASPAVTELPWAQKTLDARSVHEHATGAGVVVAVVDSGVDADHPQLAGKVLRGQDFFLVGDLPGGFDCVSHGTGVASIIAARPVSGIGFAGLAPDATILPVRSAKAIRPTAPRRVSTRRRWRAGSGSRPTMARR